MTIAYDKYYQRSATRYICLHHAGGLGADARASTQHLTAANIDVAHEARFGMLSTLGHYGGYNFYIEKDGKVTQFRAVGEETAAQTGYNFAGVAISICLAGNFTPGVDTPTEAQLSSLRSLLAELPAVEIVPHRKLQPGHTECYGTALADSWGQNLVGGPSIELVMRKLSLLQQLLALMQQLNALRQRMGATLFGKKEFSCFTADNRG